MPAASLWDPASPDGGPTRDWDYHCGARFGAFGSLAHFTPGIDARSDKASQCLVCPLDALACSCTPAGTQAPCHPVAAPRPNSPPNDPASRSLRARASLSSRPADVRPCLALPRHAAPSAHHRRHRWQGTRRVCLLPTT